MMLAQEGTHFNHNQMFINIAKEAIRLLQREDTIRVTLLNDMNAYFKAEKLDRVHPGVNKITAKRLINYIPGLADKDKFRWEILWSSPLKRPLYRLPQPLIDQYQAGFIDNGFWCDCMSNIQPNIWEKVNINDLLCLVKGEDSFKEEMNKLKNGKISESLVAVLPASPESHQHQIDLFVGNQHKYGLKKLRPEQERFARRVSERYRLQCVVCGITEIKLLQAAHIKPKSENGSDEPENGLILCANHHLAFDHGLLCIEPATLKVIALSHIQVTHHDLNHLLQKPATEMLAWHYEHHKTKSG